MQRIVIDTNVLVSALIQRSFPFLVISSIPGDDNIKWCISNEVLAEYKDVLGRAKFLKYYGFAANAKKLLVDIETTTLKYDTGAKLSVIKDDSDNKFLELAVACKAHFIITGNTQDFTMSNFGVTRIVTPKEYCENYL